MIGTGDEEEEQEERVLDIAEALFPERGTKQCMLSYDEFVEDVVAPLISKLSTLASVSDIMESVDFLLETRFGATVAMPFDEDSWNAFLEKIGEDAELYLDEESDTDDSEPDAEILLEDEDDGE